MGHIIITHDNYRGIAQGDFEAVSNLVFFAIGHFDNEWNAPFDCGLDLVSRHIPQRKYLVSR